ncbi:hypothetical protein FDG96_gp56 [Bacillus phage Mgbh1]|uniref:Uncharacterized protein n=1 Tax=Bacillus phage Mgbh1 TaxID=1796993 RepID=A0A142F1Q8_9CAUD|nr:hypothetical protein FDG96_gp56 [Bacillus phage Mgbh1]AMQ66715.1 hypothetical protein [Bacillus phage Mgbh1]
MAKLSILGAQRVKALIEILNEKKEEEMKQVRDSLPSMSEVKRLADEKMGISHLSSELELLKGQMEKLSAKLNDAKGVEIRVRIDTNWRHPKYEEYTKVEEEIRRELIDSKLQEVERKYKDKENRLWLCETLEEAKEIVGI